MTHEVGSSTGWWPPRNSSHTNMSGNTPKQIDVGGRTLSNNRSQWEHDKRSVNWLISAPRHQVFFLPPKFIAKLEVIPRGIWRRKSIDSEDSGIHSSLWPTFHGGRRTSRDCFLRSDGSGLVGQHVEREREINQIQSPIDGFSVMSRETTAMWHPHNVAAVNRRTPAKQ